MDINCTLLLLLILAAQPNSDGAAAAGAAALVAGFIFFWMVADLVLAIVWIVFPFIVISRLGYLTRASHALRAELQAPRMQLSTPLQTSGNLALTTAVASRKNKGRAPEAVLCALKTNERWI